MSSGLFETKYSPRLCSERRTQVFNHQNLAQALLAQEGKANLDLKVHHFLIAKLRVRNGRVLHTEHLQLKFQPHVSVLNAINLAVQGVL